MRTRRKLLRAAQRAARATMTGDNARRCRVQNGVYRRRMTSLRGWQALVEDVLFGEAEGRELAARGAR